MSVRLSRRQQPPFDPDLPLAPERTSSFAAARAPAADIHRYLPPAPGLQLRAASC